MKKSINFTATRNIVTADTYVAHELYKRNEAIINELGGEILRGVGGFKAQFKTAAQAKKFVEKAITSISKKEYEKARKSVASEVTAPKAGRGKKNAEKFITLTDDNGNTYKVPMSALGIVSVPSTKASAPAKAKTTKPVTKGKGKSNGCGVDFSKLAGKGKKANSQASALINKAGYANNTPEYMKAWAVWCEVR